MFSKIAVLLSFVAAANAACDNQCSGHGTCGFDDVCTCYDNWGLGQSHDSGDCSDRVCPFELAWVDTPDKDGVFHKYQECAGRGICDRALAECNCFTGFEGKGCQRSSCPNDCSGHGTCEFIEDMGFAATWNDLTPKGHSDNAATFSYNAWDEGKTRGCVCDALYGDVDCSKRMCPYGTDVLDTRDDLLVSTKYQTQDLYFLPQNSLTAGTGAAGAGFDGATFALTFKSRLNETYTTIPIVISTGTNTGALAEDVHLALLSLPNRVIDGVKVAVSNVGSTPYLGGIHIAVTFNGAAVQGPQHLLIVEDYQCDDGCTPKLSGVNLWSRYLSTGSNTTETVLADYNSYECGRRGKCDYTSGLCGCFLGYTGDNCDTLSTLV